MDQQATTCEAHAQTEDGGRRSRAARAGTFLRHLLEMGVPMLVGMATLDPVYRWAVGQLGYSDPYLQLPELTLLVGAFNMTLPMAAWMRFRGMDWGSIADMSGAMFGASVLIISGYWLGLLPNVRAGGMSTLGHLQCSVMLPAMLVPMVLRLDRYTSHTGHTRHASHAS